MAKKQGFVTVAVINMLVAVCVEVLALEVVGLVLVILLLVV